MTLESEVQGSDDDDTQSEVFISDSDDDYLPQNDIAVEWRVVEGRVVDLVHVWWVDWVSVLIGAWWIMNNSTSATTTTTSTPTCAIITPTSTTTSTTATITTTTSNVSSTATTTTSTASSTSRVHVGVIGGFIETSSTSTWSSFPQADKLLPNAGLHLLQCEEVDEMIYFLETDY
ncbi:hypothetical protein E2C01_073090 [Portunus trituberculatus]|uniref:Uncharacterized protein n=1 Tax=Portunus trituberculatus TaxID=210409 RepID=A0A5B7I9N4_PORTR|nr:hypothetical protein [Portunus trituberculatus]